MEIWRWFQGNWEGVSALVISGCALYLTIRVREDTIKHNKLSVKPALIYSSRYIGEEKIFKVSIVNKGVGPAIITKISIWKLPKKNTLDFSNLKEEDLKAFVKGIGFNKKVRTGLEFNSFINRTTLSSGEPLDLITVKLIEDGYGVKELQSFHSSIGYLIEYYSIYEDEKMTIGST